MALSNLQQEIHNSKQIFEKSKVSYDRISTLTTLIAVLSPILVAQTWNYFIRLAGAGFLLLNLAFLTRTNDSFSNWIGHQKKYHLLKLEYFKYQAGLEDYDGLDEKTKYEIFQNRNDIISEEIVATMNILQLELLNLKEELLEHQDSINGINKNMKEIVENLKNKYPTIFQARFTYYVLYRYLDQLNWYYNRINADKKSLRKKDIKKSVYFHFRSNYIISAALKITSFGITILTGEMVLSFFGIINVTEISIFLIFTATIVSIISSMYSEIDKIQKNRENTITYLLTVKNLERIYSEFIADYNEDLNLDDLNKIQKLFVEKSEQAFLQENVKWKEIQRSKTMK